MPRVKTVVNAAEAIAGLKALERELKLPAVKAALRTPGSAIAKRMKANAPVLAGYLRDSITQRTLSSASSDRVGLNANETVGVLIGPNAKVKGKSRTGVALLMEDGAKAHEIAPRARNKHRVLSFLGDFVTGAIHHPGFRATHFMQRAISETEAQVPDLFYGGLQRFLDKQGPTTE